MKAAAKVATSAEDQAVIKAMKLVKGLTDEDVALSKFESLMRLMKDDYEVPHLKSLNINDKIKYESHYAANQLLIAMNSQLEEETNILAKASAVSILADESTDIANKKRMTIQARTMDGTLVRQKRTTFGTKNMSMVQIEDSLRS